MSKIDGLRRVEILRHRVAERAAAETDDATLPRPDREKKAIAESVAVAAALSLAEKSRLRRQWRIDSALIQIAAQRVTIGGKTQTEPLGDLGRNAALREHVATGGSGAGVA